MSDATAIDLSGLDFLPKWGTQMDAAKLREFEAREEGGGHSFGGRRPDRDRGFGGGRDSRGGGNRGSGNRSSGGNRQDGRGQGTRPAFGQSQGQGQAQPGKGTYTRRETSDRPQQQQHQGGGQRRFERPQPPAILEDIEVSVIPTSASVAALAQQIKSSARAYPIFDVAGVILQNSDRYQIRIAQKGAVTKGGQQFHRKPKHQGEGEQGAAKSETPAATEVKDEPKAAPAGFFICRLDHTPWLSEAQAVRHVLEKHGESFYTTETVAAEAPKGNFTFVAVCGMSGTNLGPPNHHDYQNKLRAIHATRFSHTPFESYRSRIKTVRDEALVKAWMEEQSSRVEYVSVKRPEDPRLKGKGEVEAHFRQYHLGEVIYRGASVTLTKPEHVKNVGQEIGQAVKWTVEDQKRFPISMVNLMRMEFNRHGLHVFKLSNKDNITYVGVARPRRIDLVNTPMAVGVRKIVDWLLVTPKATKQSFMHDFAGVTDDALKAAATNETNAPAKTAAAAPAPVQEAPQAAEVTEVAQTEAVTETAEQAPVAETAVASTESAPVIETTATTEAPASEAPAAAAPVEAKPQLTHDQVDALRNLRWLMYEGYVVELANGTLFTPQPNANGQQQGNNNNGQQQKKGNNQNKPAAAPAQEAVASEAVQPGAVIASVAPSEDAAPVATAESSDSENESQVAETEVSRDEEVALA
ncbi:MAG: hypothetical protein ACAI35_20515 [Candidatus Methylacidiphilales bacterium]